MVKHGVHPLKSMGRIQQGRSMDSVASVGTTRTGSVTLQPTQDKEDGIKPIQ